MKKFKKLEQKGDVSMVFIILLVILLILGVAFYVWQKNNDDTAGESYSDNISQPAETEIAKEPDTKETACKDPSSSVVENTKASISSGNTAALEGYMVSKVTVATAAGKVSKDQTPTQAVKDITDFIGDPTATTWDFNLSASVLSSYAKGSYKTYFSDNAVVGKSSSGKVISFNFDCDGKIDTVLEASDEKKLQ